MLHNPLILVVPVTLVAWMFRSSGLFYCLFFMTCILWIHYAQGYSSILLPVSVLIPFAISMVTLLIIGMLVVLQRDSLDQADNVQRMALRIYAQNRKLDQIKDEFLQNVNHELRTPLTAIYGYLELLLEHDEQLDSNTRITFLQHAMQSCDELQLLVNNVLDSMGMEKEKLHLYIEELPVIDIVYEVLERFDPKSVQEHSIHVDVPEYIVVCANAQYFRQVLRNLLSNAFKYVPAGTPIRISASLYGLVVDPDHAPPEVCVCVADAGPGIPRSELPHLFGQFVRLRRDTSGRVRGSGLGLFLSRQFVEAMGGRIWVESEGIEGKGSSFYFTLPCVVRPKVQAHVHSSDFDVYLSPVPIDIKIS
jgi:signal transduction histidine kinase